MNTTKQKRGFTIVELVIVIAVIAILAAVLIPTFSNVIARAKVSADTQLCRNLNTVLTMATSEGRVPTSMYDVLYLASESGYLIGNLNPTAEGYYFAWDSEAQKIVYIREDLASVMYPEDYKLNPSTCWVTVGSQAEAEAVAAKGFNLYLENKIDAITLTDVAVSIDTGAYSLGNLTINGTSAEAKSVVLSGNFDKTDISIGNTSVSTTGSIKSLNVSGGVTGMNIQGNIGSYSGTITNTTMSSTGAIGSIINGSVTNTQGATFSSTDTVINGTLNSDKTGSVAIQIGTKEAIENIRTQIAGGRTFAGETITLANDINMAGIAFQPMSNNDRDHKEATDTAKWFQGEFDGQGHTIKNFSTNGFSISGLNAGTNDSSVQFAGGATYSEAVYGLFGTIYVPFVENADGEYVYVETLKAGKKVFEYVKYKEGTHAADLKRYAPGVVTIKNLNIEVAVDMVIDDANKYVGDSVGGLIGFAYGVGTLNIENVTVSGTINSYDSVSAFIGRAYGERKDSKLTINFKNCTNNATVTGIRKTGAFIGYANNTTATSDQTVVITFENCTNNGKITCLGIEKDQELGALKKGKPVTGTNGSGYYAKGMYVGSSSVEYNTIEGLTNNGTFGEFYHKG